MVVDDSASNLKLLERVLVEQGLSVRTFLRGAAALAAAEQGPPDLVLLDINMPEMSGYEVCERLKADGPLSGIPVVFLSALSEAEDRVKGFRVGAVDYIPKPFEIEEVLARVETHLKLRRAHQVERELLERTLGGAVTALWELVQLTSPVLALRSRAIREIVCWIATRVPTRDPWQCELAATLCLVGCIALPDEVFERGYAGQDLSPDEAQMFRAHPERAARLLSGIPRLEVVAEIIRNQQSSEKDLAAMTTSEFGREARKAKRLRPPFSIGVGPQDPSGRWLPLRGRSAQIVRPIRRRHSGCARQLLSNARKFRSASICQLDKFVLVWSWQRTCGPMMAASSS